MDKLITCENIRDFAYVNEKLCRKPIRGIVLSFFGLGSCCIYNDDIPEGELYGKEGLLYVAPYTNPWSWMNAAAVAYADEVVDVLIEKYSLPGDIPVVSTGGSMGGQSAFVYSLFSKRTPVACVTDCPVCDAVFHYTERNDLPRTFYSALWNEPGPIEEALKNISPLHLINRLPRIPYFIFYGTADSLVSPEAHVKKFAALMCKNGHDITVCCDEGSEHCNLSPSAKAKFAECIIKSVG